MEIYLDGYMEVSRARALLWAAQMTEDAWDKDTFLSMCDEVLKGIQDAFVNLDQAISAMA